MGVKWASGLMHWEPHVDRAGRANSLAHLHPFRYDLTLPEFKSKPERIVEIQVGFSSHVFTCKLPDAAPDADPYEDDRERRWFDEARYQASFGLEAIVRDLVGRKIFSAKNQNFLTIENARAPAGTEYEYSSMSAD